MRDRLIELTEASLIRHIGKSCKLAENIADDLLYDGVIVLPCKVGDTVYQTDGIRIYELEIFDISLRKGKPYYETESIDFDNTAIGESIFLTREEAEEALKGGG